MKVDLKRLVKKEILPHYEGFNYHRQLLFKEPIMDLIAGFCFERIEDHLYLWHFFEPVFYPDNNGVYFTFGKRIADSQGTMKTYWLDEMRLEKTIEELDSDISNNIDFITQLEDVGRFYEFFLESSKNTTRAFEKIVYTACYLKKPNASDLLSEFIVRVEKIILEDDRKWIIEMLEQAKLLRSTIQKGEEETIKLFTEWREFTLNGLGLKKWDGGSTIW